MLVYFNPLKLSGITHSYQLVQSISVLRVVGRYSYLLRLIWVFTECTFPTKRSLGLYELIVFFAVFKFIYLPVFFWHFIYVTFVSVTIVVYGHTHFCLFLCVLFVLCKI